MDPDIGAAVQVTHELQLTGISHNYGDGDVLTQVDLTVAAGSVHALLGLNGAGKSTLVHIASGQFPPTQGTILIDGSPVRFRGPADAIEHGVVLLSQEVDRALAPTLTVHENLTAGLLLREHAAFFSPRRNRQRAQDMLRRFEIDIDPNALVAQLSLFEKQVLSLARAVATDASYIILDEPTASFDKEETAHFYRIVHEMTASGIGIIFISHRLDEVLDLADTVTVLRGGRVALHADRADITKERIVSAIAGGNLEIHPHESQARVGQSILDAQELNYGPRRRPLHLHIDAGEIIAIFGNLGTGKTSLAQTLFGLREPYTAQISGEQRTIRSAQDARAAGIALVPEERRRQGVWLNESILTHFSLGSRGIIHNRAEREHAEQVTRKYDVQVSSIDQTPAQLSGGNQQKVSIGKWDALATTLLVLDEPMKGVDVVSRESIIRRIEERASSGVAVIYLTQEPEEALRIADRVVLLDNDGPRWDRPAAGLTIADLLNPDPATAEPHHTSGKTNR